MTEEAYACWQFDEARFAERAATAGLEVDGEAS
jgi:hypothetical protein